MSLKGLPKKRLVEMANTLNLDEEGTKLDLETRISEHFDNHPELAEDAEFKKYVQFRQSKSPVKTTQVVESIQAIDETVAASPGKLLSIGERFRSFASPFRAKTVESTDADDDETDDTDDSVEVISAEKQEGTDEEEEEKVPFSETVKEWYEDQKEMVLDWYYDGIDAVVDKSNSVKKSLSTAESVNYITTATEAALLLRAQVPMIPLREAPFFDQAILSKYTKYINLNLKISDLSVFTDLKVSLVFLSWFLVSVVGPLVGSYYFNFIGKKQKKVKFDPMVFNLIKLLFAYAFLSTTVSFDDIKNNAEVWADENGLIAASFLQKAKAHAFHNSLTLKLVLGNLPFVNGFVGVLVALYIAAI